MSKKDMEIDVEQFVNDWEQDQRELEAEYKKQLKDSENWIDLFSKIVSYLFFWIFQSLQISVSVIGVVIIVSFIMIEPEHLALIKEEVYFEQLKKGYIELCIIILSLSFIFAYFLYPPWQRVGNVFLKKAEYKLDFRKKIRSQYRIAIEVTEATLVKYNLIDKADIRKAGETSGQN